MFQLTNKIFTVLQIKKDPKSITMDFGHMFTFLYVEMPTMLTES